MRRAALAFAVLAVATLALAARADAFVYWTNSDIGTIVRADLNGTAPNQGFITGASFPHGIAVDGARIYWANPDPNTIGRANLDGNNVDQSFITGVDGPFGVAVDARGPIDDLIASVKALNLAKGTENSLLQKLDAAQENLNAGNTSKGCDQRASFISEVKAQRAKKISPASAADALIDGATAVRASVPCG